MKNLETRFTEKENALINAIINSDFSNGDLQDPIWLPLPEECGFSNNKILSGVVSQLVQKGIIDVEGTGKDSTIWLTQKYVDLN